MSETKMTRQELYDEIKKSSKDAFILKEMKRLGFWDSSKPKVAQELIERKTTLQKELNALSNKIQNPESVIKEIHQKRMKEALVRREETKAKREAKNQEKQLLRQKNKEEKIGFIGKEFIVSVDKTEFNEALLAKNSLFIIKDAKDLANKMGITLKELRFLTYRQKLSTQSNYIRFKMAKKSGGFRNISAPKPRLKKLQTWILENILNKVSLNEKAQGFVPKKSIVTNATPHLNQAVVINCDLENFFPTLTYARVRGLFESLGYSLEIATLLTLLSTEPQTQEVVVDGEKLYLYTGNAYLPQGSPASPMITNIICRKLDNRMSGIAQSLGFNYSRYADDMTFSAPIYENINKMMFWIKGIVKEEGFILHPNKTRIMKKGSRQEVTGIVVNEKLSINRKELKKFRALLHQIEHNGVEGKSWHQATSENLIYSILGYAHFIKMVDSKKGEVYLAKIKAIMKKYDIDPYTFTPKVENKCSLEKAPLETVEEPKEEAQSFLDDILKLFRK